MVRSELQYIKHCWAQLPSSNRLRIHRYPLHGSPTYELCTKELARLTPARTCLESATSRLLGLTKFYDSLIFCRSTNPANPAFVPCSVVQLKKLVIWVIVTRSDIETQ